MVIRNTFLFFLFALILFPLPIYPQIKKEDLFSKASIQPVKAGTKTPLFSLQDLNEKKSELKQYRGKVVFLNFWATWCGPCRKEIPGFIEVYNEYKDKGMAIIGISLDETGLNSVLRFAEKYNINYPVAMGTNKIVKDYQLGRFIPETTIIDKNGKIRDKHIGYMDKNTLKNYFLKLVEEK